MSHILIIDDKIKVCQSLAQNFEHLDYTAHIATDSRKALELLDHHPVGVALLDLALGDEDGLAVLENLLSHRPGLAVIMITGYGTVESAVKAIKMGARDFIEKPLKFDRLLAVVKNALDLAELKAENSRLRERVAGLCPAMISQSSPILALLDRARRLAATEMPVLISGESGTGKELLANFIHAHSLRSAHPLQKVNSSAFAENLLDNELFGHEKGAYTGADDTFVGLFEQAHGGSLFLDEIGDMALSTQAKILRVLQEKEIKRLGGRAVIAVDVRIIAATNRSLNKLIEDGQFRQDLYYRLNAAVLDLPPLRERKEDIPLLLRHFLDQFATDHGRTIDGADDQVLHAFFDYDWPGNIREFKNVVTYAAALAESHILEVADLPAPFTPDRATPQSGLGTIEELEKAAILKTLALTENNKKQAAEILGITRKTLYNKLEKYGMGGGDGD